ncbi:MAG: CBS domain-containing protein [Alphaproteobacteria bacterium]|nr:CBS domain-containing protein [Alphaproteobacteria bacterium]
MSSSEPSTSANKSYIKKILLKLLFWRKAKEPTLRDTIEELIEEDECAEQQSIAENEREILGNVLSLHDVQVQDIMVPRVEIEAVAVTAHMEELISKFVETQKSMIVVYQGNIDNVLGAVYLRDVINWFKMNKPFNLSIFVKEILFVPPTMRSLDLLLKMRETGIKSAIVVDEYGGVDGLVAFRDIIEEIIGDIQDATEIKNQKKKVIKNSDGSVIADGRATFEELKKYGSIQINPDDDTIDTIGGLISSIAGRVPVRGELVTKDDVALEFEIIDADPRRIKSVRIRKTG